MPVAVSVRQKHDSHKILPLQSLTLQASSYCSVPEDQTKLISHHLLSLHKSTSSRNSIPNMQLGKKKVNDVTVHQSRRKRLDSLELCIKSGETYRPRAEHPLVEANRKPVAGFSTQEAIEINNRRKENQDTRKKRLSLSWKQVTEVYQTDSGESRWYGNR